MQNTRHLIVLGATPDVRARLDELKIENITYTDNPVDAMDAALQHPDHVLAYAAGVFGLAVTGQPVRVGCASRAVMLLAKAPGAVIGTDTSPWRADDAAAAGHGFSDDPEALAAHAGPALKLKLVIFLDVPPAVAALEAILMGGENNHLAVLATVTE